MKTKLFMIAMCVILMTVGCSIPGDYVQADRDTFTAISPEYIAYISGDQKLDEEQVLRRMLLIESWRIRIEKAEAGSDR